jgi:hypothetical protein
MRIDSGNLWTYPAHIRVITTNGVVDRNGCAVMGKGIALQAKQRYPNLPQQLGELLLENGNHVYYLDNNIISFPTKHHWKEMSNISLIRRSALELREKIISKGLVVAMPPPGCGNGGLVWKDVYPILEDILDDSFVVLFNEERTIEK